MFNDLPAILLNLSLPGVRCATAAGLFGIARRVSTHPETRLALVGYLSDIEGEKAREVPRLGSIADIAAVADSYEIERVVVTEQEQG